MKFYRFKSSRVNAALLKHEKINSRTYAAIEDSDRSVHICSWRSKRVVNIHVDNWNAEPLPLHIFSSCPFWRDFIKRLAHYKNTPIQIYWEFYHQKKKTFRWKIFAVFIFLLET